MKSCYWLKLSEFQIAIADLCDYYHRGWIITRINVPEMFRGSGHGRKLLELITKDADAEKVVLFLEPAASGGLTQEQLVAWYNRHGFKYSKGILRRLPHES